MATLEQLRARREELLRARSSGVQSYVSKSGNGIERQVSYRSDHEMAAAIRDLSAQIAAAENRTAPNFIRVRATKGT